MSLRSDYEAAKRRYHAIGNALRKERERGASATIIKGHETTYASAKREYHRTGRKLAKKGR